MMQNISSDGLFSDKKNTTKSFIVPNLPDMSGILAARKPSRYDNTDETPTRPSTAGKDAPTAGAGLVEKAGLRQDERDIWVSIEVLQERINVLEKEKADLKLANTELSKKKRPDSAYGPGASEEDIDDGNVGLKEEKMS